MYLSFSIDTAHSTTMNLMKEKQGIQIPTGFERWPFKFIKQIWAGTQENLSSVFAKNKGADQPAHPRRLISTFVICFFESIICTLNTGEISIF